MNKHVFDRSGLASLDDLHVPAVRELFAALEREQEAFLKLEASFRSPGYKWPAAPLHTWNRCWEYPYVYHAITDRVLGAKRSGQPVLADLGSGVTFFPFAVAKLGCQVVCTDVDPICGPDFERVKQVVAGAPGDVGFRPCTPERLPFDDGACDGVYCIGVLEHIKEPEATVGEIFRVLRPGGLFCLTIDLDLCGGHEIGPEGYAGLRELLRSRFTLAAPEVTIHPSRMLTTSRGPFPLPETRRLEGLRLLAKQVLQDYLGSEYQPVTKYLLAVEGTLWRKPSRSRQKS